MKYKVKSTGIDTRNYKSIFPDINPDYIITSPMSGNDYILEPGIDDDSGKLVVIMEKDPDPSILLYHLQALHRSAAEIVLLEQTTKYLDDYMYLRETGYIKELGYYLPADISGLIKDTWVSAVGIKIDPLHFDLDLLKYAEEKGITLFGFSDFDNNLPDTFNLSFYGRYCDCVVTEGYSPERISYLQGLRDLEAPVEVEMTKSVNKKGKLSIYASLKINENLIIPCTDLETIINPEEVVFGLGKEIEKIEEPEEYDEFQELVLELWRGLQEKKHTYSREELIDLMRYRSVALIDKSYNLGFLSRYAFVLVIRESKKKKIYKNYLFYVSEDRKFYIRNLKNALQEG